MATFKKVTIQIPKLLLIKAQQSTHAGITETIRKGLEILAASRAYEDLKDFRGKLKFSVDLKELRED